MKFLAVISVVLVAALLVGCGGAEDDQTTATLEPIAKLKEQAAAHRHQQVKLAMSKQEIAKLPKLEIKRLSGPPPKHLEVIDLRKGTGPVVRPRDAIVIKFFSVNYDGALTKSYKSAGYEERFGMNEVIKGWAVGLRGMRVGGRRELIVPPRFGYQVGTIQVYVIDLLAVERNGGATF